jgi:hypothetical protein
MPRIELSETTAPFQLQPDWLCLTKNGWLDYAEEVQVQLPAGMPVLEAMQVVWEQNKGQLGGKGELVFVQTATVPMPTGFITWRPPGQAAEPAASV